MADDVKQLKFPSRAERKALLQQLRDLQQNPQIAADENFKSYAAGMEALDEKMNALSEVDGDGVPRSLTKEDADDLAKTIVETANFGERYMLNAYYTGQNLREGTPAMIDRLQSMLSRDFDALKNYDPAQPKSLPELQESTRTSTIDLRGRTLGAMRNLQNDRIPMTVVNAKGEKRKGFFTKATHLQARGMYDEIINKAKNTCKTQQQKDELDKYLEGFRQQYIGKKLSNDNWISKNTTDAMLIGAMSAALYSKYKGNKIKPANVKEDLAAAGLDPNLLPSAALKVLAKEFTKLKDNVGLELNTNGLELPDGTRLDNRNTAMSAVATLLGTSELLARSDNMKFIGEDGTVTEGTFMDYAKGVDLYKKPHLLQHVKEDHFGEGAKKAKVFKQIADLQVLDYICMNKDRHQGNLLYEVDKEGHIVGIQGIDNDTSFGTDLGNGLELENLAVISRSMADKLQHITPAMLKFALRGRGLSEQELDAAGHRLKGLQDWIRDHPEKVIDDDKLGEKTAVELYPPNENKNNVFKLTNRWLTTTGNLVRDTTVPFEPLPDQPEPNLKEVSSLDRRGTVGGLTDSLGKISRKVSNDENGFNVDDLTTRMRGSSPEFKKMVAAAKEAKDLMLQLKQDGKVDASKLAQEDPETMEKVLKAFGKVNLTTSDYLTFKLKDRGANSLEELTGHNKYEQKHIDYAKDLQKITNDFFKNFTAPETKDEIADQQANIQRRELEENRKVAEQKKQNAPVLQ